MMFVEVLDRHGDVRARSRIDDADEFTVGRAYDNDLILDDPFVSPHHLRIVRAGDGSLQARDLGTVNGLHVPGSEGASAVIDISDDVRIRIGHTQLRFRSRTFQVPEAIPVMPVPSLLRHTTAFYVMLLTAGGLLALEAQLATFGEPQPAQLVASVLATLLGALIWTGLWSFAGRIATRRANFHAHGAATLAALVALVVVNNVADYLEFTVSGTLAEVFLRTAIALIIVALIYRQLRLVSRISTRRAALSVGALVLVLLGSGWLVESATDAGYSNRLDFPSALKPPAFLWRDGLTPEAFVERASGIHDELDRLRSRD
jgi:pSer/pThr/pTyr-binding forkhead associated (FHA) protein